MNPSLTVLEIGKYNIDLLGSIDSISSIISINTNRTGDNVTSKNGRTGTILNLMKDKTVFDLMVINNCDTFEIFSDIIYDIRRFFHDNTQLKILISVDNFNWFKHYQHYFINIGIKLLGNIMVITCRLDPKYLINYETCLPTIITSLYDIRSLESNDTAENIKRIDRYFELGNFILSLEYPLIIYTEEKLKEKILSLRPKEYHDITTIKVIPLEKIYYYKNVEKIKLLQQGGYVIKNRSLTKDTPLYISLVNNKFWFMEESINENIYKSDRFLWMDFGINHVAEYPESIRRWFRNMPEKIRCLECNLNLDNDNYREYFTEIHHNTAGGIISGTCDNMLKYVKLCQVQAVKILEDNWYQLEEAIMGMVTRDNPELFDNFYGSFNNYIIGYDHYTNLEKNWTINTINYMIQQCLNKSQHKKCYQILQYIKDHFLYNNDKWDYLNKYIICNYYISDNKTLDNDIMQSVFDKPNLQFIEKNIPNLKFYRNLGA